MLYSKTLEPRPYKSFFFWQSTGLHFVQGMFWISWEFFKVPLFASLEKALLSQGFRKLWPLKSEPTWQSVTFFVLVCLFVFYTDSFSPGRFYSRAWPALRPIPAIRSVHADLSPQCPTDSRGLRPSGSNCRTGTLTVSSNIHAPSQDLVFTRHCRRDLPLLFGFGGFYFFLSTKQLGISRRLHLFWHMGVYLS